MTFFGSGRARIVARFVVTGFALGTIFPFFTCFAQPLPAISAASAAASSQSGSAVSTVGPANINYEEIPGPNGGPATSFKVRRDLSIQATRYFTFRFTPEASNKNGTQKLPDGYYKLQLVFALQNVKILALGRKPTREERYVTSARKLVRYENGEIKTDLALVFPDVTALRTQLILYTQLIPIQQSSLKIKNGNLDLLNSSVDISKISAQPGVRALVSKNFFIPILDKSDHLSSAGDATSNDEIAADLTGYLDSVENQPRSTPTNAICPGDKVDESCYIAAEKLVYVPIDSDYFNQVLVGQERRRGGVPRSLNRDALRQMLAITDGTTIQPLPDQLDPSVTRALCISIILAQNPPSGIYATPYGRWLYNCEQSPTEYLQFTKNVHVRHFTSPAIADATEDVEHSLQVLSSVIATKARTLNLHYGFSVGSSISPLGAMGAGPLAGSLFNVGASVGLTETDYRSYSQNGTEQEYSTLKVVPYRFTIPTDRYRVCLAITPNAFNWPTTLVQQGLYVCDDEKTIDKDQSPLLLPEVYYYASQDVQDRAQSSPQALNLLMRGERDYSVFRGNLVQYLGSMRDQPQSMRDSYARAGALFAKYPITPPGMITYPMLPRSELANLVGGYAEEDTGIFARAKAMLSDSWHYFGR